MRHVPTARTAALAAALAGTLIAGTVTAGAPPALAATGAVARAAATSPGAPAVTLVTGDRVVLAGDGGVAQLVRAPGRAGIVFSVRREAGHTQVIPQDALRMIGDGVLDRRLFDVTQLIADGYDDAHRSSVPLIISYRRDAAGAGALAATRDALAGVARERRPLAAVDGEAFAVAKSEAGSLWSAVSGASRDQQRVAGAAPSAPAGPVAHLWLDGRVRGALDVSVPQIGAPAMWRAGWTGKGVTVAVLDTGVDETHPDLRGAEVAERNFTSAPTTQDRNGHGTHVASTIAGTGALSGGRYRGVAPDARILDGKVLDDDAFGAESNILSGMEWAVDQGAQIVNMSLSTQDFPETDPLEDGIARLSDRALFVVAAGNHGPGPGTITSPGSAPEALTVGAVDKQDRIADFSSQGPARDGTSKPDLTAPGVDITAAATTQGDFPSDTGYATMSGTSMATPHAAGAAALLLQQHPTWSGAQLKGLLTGSAKPDPALGASRQGAGRVDLTRAVTAAVVSEPGSLDFGTQLWPHTDDEPTAKTLTYRNYGARAVTLHLSVAGSDAAGGPAPEGMFTVRDGEVTVPAGGSASTTVTVDTRKGTTDGAFGGSVLATGGDQSVRTGLAAVREAESYDVTLRHTDVNGGSPLSFYSTVTTLGTAVPEPVDFPNDPSGTVTRRLPKGDYQLESFDFGPDGTMAVFVQPVLKVTGKTTVVLDARKAKPFAITTPDRRARLVSATVGYEDEHAFVHDSWVTDGSTRILTAALGPSQTGMRAQYNGLWKKPGAAGAGVDYRLAFDRTGSWFTGLTHTVTRAELAEVKLGFGASVTGAKALISAVPTDADGFTVGAPESAAQDLPLASAQFVSAGDVRWSWTASQLNAQGEPRIGYTAGPLSYRPGARYAADFNTPVVGPDLAAGDQQGALRTGDSLDARIQLFNDGAGHSGSSVVTDGFSRLESGGRVLAEGAATDWLSAEVPPAPARYRLSVEASRSPEDTSTSTRVAASWTFTSAHADGDRSAVLPLSTVSFSPRLRPDGTAPKGTTLRVPLRLGGSAASGGRVAALTVQVSYDGGASWKPVSVTTDSGGNRSVTLTHPPAATSVSLRADLTDRGGNTVRETIVNAYRLAP
ncbi:S8 family serine peptidase [Streptomyces sp. NPDC048507]|uniref:S8 family serine peptidase n=1 Tax=Streptomyces sp. NPDC048507 TaxID=3365560 RepID=UPI003716FE82